MCHVFVSGFSTVSLHFQTLKIIPPSQGKDTTLQTPAMCHTYLISAVVVAVLTVLDGCGGGGGGKGFLPTFCDPVRDGSLLDAFGL